MVTSVLGKGWHRLYAWHTAAATLLHRQRAERVPHLPRRLNFAIAASYRAPAAACGDCGLGTYASCRRASPLVEASCASACITHAPRRLHSRICASAHCAALRATRHNMRHFPAHAQTLLCLCSIFLRAAVPAAGAHGATLPGANTLCINSAVALLRACLPRQASIYCWHRQQTGGHIIWG